MRRQRQDTAGVRGGSSHLSYSTTSAPPPPLLRETQDNPQYTPTECITIDIAMDAVAEQCLSRGLNDSALWLDELHLDALPAVLDECLTSLCPLTQLVTLDTAWHTKRSSTNDKRKSCAREEMMSDACGRVARLRRHHRVALALFLRGEYQRCHYLLSHVLQECSADTNNESGMMIDDDAEKEGNEEEEEGEDEEEEEAEDVHAAELASMSEDVISPDEGTRGQRRQGVRTRREYAAAQGNSSNNNSSKKRKSSSRARCAENMREEERCGGVRAGAWREGTDNSNNNNNSGTTTRQRQRRRRSVGGGEGDAHVAAQPTASRQASLHLHSTHHHVDAAATHVHTSTAASVIITTSEEGNKAAMMRRLRRVTPPVHRRRESTASCPANIVPTTPPPSHGDEEAQRRMNATSTQLFHVTPGVPTAMQFLCYYALYMDGQKVKTTSGNPQRTLNPHLRTLRAQLMEIFCGPATSRTPTTRRRRGRGSTNAARATKENVCKPEEGLDERSGAVPHTPPRPARRSSRTSPLPQPISLRSSLASASTTTRIGSRTISPIARQTTTPHVACGGAGGSGRARVTLSSSRTTPPPPPPPPPAVQPQVHGTQPRSSPGHNNNNNTTTTNDDDEGEDGGVQAAAQFPADLMHQDPYLCWLMGVVLRDLGMSQESATYLLASVTNNPLLWCAWQDLALLITHESQIAEMEAILSSAEPRFMTELFLAHVKAALGLTPLSRGFHACHFAAAATQTQVPAQRTAHKHTATSPTAAAAAARRTSVRAADNPTNYHARPAPVIATRDDNKVNTLNRTTSHALGSEAAEATGPLPPSAHGSKEYAEPGCAERTKGVKAAAGSSLRRSLHATATTTNSSSDSDNVARHTTQQEDEDDDADVVRVENASERSSSSSSNSSSSSRSIITTTSASSSTTTTHHNNSTSDEEQEQRSHEAQRQSASRAAPQLTTAHSTTAAAASSSPRSPSAPTQATRLQNTWKLLLELFPSSLYLQGRLAAYYYHQRKELDKAQQIYAEIHRRSPCALDHVADYSNILFIQRDYHALSSLAQQVYQVDPFRAESNFVVGNFYVAVGQHERSVLHFRRAVAIQPSFVAAWTLLGHGYVELKNTTAAVEAYRTAIELDQRDYRGWYNLGQIYELLQAYHHALYYYWHTTSLRPTDPRMWAAVGSCLEHDGRRQESIICLERAEAYESVHSDIYPGLVRRIGDYYATQGEYVRACVYLDKLLQSPATSAEDRRYAMHNLVQFHIMLANQVITPVLRALDRRESRAPASASAAAAAAMYVPGNMPQVVAEDEEEDNNMNALTATASGGGGSRGRRRTTARYMPSTFGRTSPPYACAENNTSNNSMIAGGAVASARLPDVLRSSTGSHGSTGQQQQQQQQEQAQQISYKHDATTATTSTSQAATALQLGRRAGISHETLMRAERQAMLHIRTAETQLENLLTFLGATTLEPNPVTDTASQADETLEESNSAEEGHDTRMSHRTSHVHSSPASAHTTPLHTATMSGQSATSGMPLTSSPAALRATLRSSLHELRAMPRASTHARRDEAGEAEDAKDEMHGEGRLTPHTLTTPAGRRGGHIASPSATAATAGNDMRERQLEALYASLVRADPSDKSGMGLFVRVMRRQLLLMRQMLQQLRSAMR